MRKTWQTTIAEATLDLVVPFTTPALTRAALAAAESMGAGLNASIRLLKVQIVPYPLDLTHPPVPLEFLREQVNRLRRDPSVRCEVRLAREFKPGLEAALGEHSLVLLATYKRPWRTSTERLALSLRRNGRTVVLVQGGKDSNA